ncbi:hypothetical protein [Hymenobacter cellulosilyticus]|uniref:Lipoprotein n=1 Tax=Hymenobacter cellulosilyticus TaxID=2932248 RepID=A0A8T9Q8W7_9BACT|nr:hypothetical protein [Hymenobacter cellulosilyticus]UOQ72548.1 hypothetical protein MUN79_00650 [Hymenobacter cellulosilyticus]
MKHLFWLAGLSLGLAACRPDAPASAPVARNHDNLPAGPFRSADADQATSQDTLHTADGSVLHVTPVSADYFARLPDPLGRYLDSTLTATSGRVRREHDDLIFRPEQGPEVRLHTVLSGSRGPDDPTGRAVHSYWTELPKAHQWVVVTEEENRRVTTLIDQRTGQRTEVVGEPAVSPDGRYLIGVKSDQANDGSDESATGIQLFQLGAGPPRLLWTRQTLHWGATRARWSGPRTVVLEQERTPPSQEEDGPPPTYVEVTLPDPKA